jgi:hypothetical protein
MIVAVHRSGIDAAYGAGSWTRLDPVLRDYVRSLSDAGIRPSLLYLDAPDQSGLSGAAPAALGDASVAASLIRRSVQQRTVTPRAVLLIGGEEALPMFRFPARNTLPLDVDADIPTDNPYGCLREGEGVEVDPELAVGRFAAGVDDGVEAIVAQVAAARQHRQRPPLPPAGAFIVSNREWVGATDAVTAAIVDQPHLQEVSPSFFLSPDSAGDFGRRILFFNLHGVTNAADYFGQNDFTAVSVDSFGDGPLQRSVVFACNCYGGAIDRRSARTSIALRLLHLNAACFIGSTGYAFGGFAGGHFDFSEVLARRFFTILGTGKPPGLALWQARREYVRLRTHNGQMANLDYKTSLQFVFLGDPLL